MELKISAERRAKIKPDMIGLFFEDINYAADGGLYAEMIENRSFEFVQAEGDARDYYFEYDGLYGWDIFPNAKTANHSAPSGMAQGSKEEDSTKGFSQKKTCLKDASAGITLRAVQGSPLSEANPHYLRVTADRADVGFSNQGYGGIALKQGMDYHLTFFARCVSYHGNFTAEVVKDGKVHASASLSCEDYREETYNYFRKYHMILHADADVSGAVFALVLTEPGTVEFDFISLFPADAVAGVFRKDLFEALKALKPGFVRFPGGCIVEGNTLSNRYRYKDSLTEPWNRKNNWNRWAVHENCSKNGFCGDYAHYNQTLGLGYYEYFLLCELIGAAPLPVMNVGFACQYQSTEQVAIGSPEFARFVKDALDLIEFANGGADTKWGAVRREMGHPEPFGLTLLGIGNEQWQTERADFFERYAAFEKAIHAAHPGIRLIGSAGPDITSARYTAAWDFYRKNADKPDFVYAVDEHYYVKPEWLYEHVDFYDDYPRNVKVFSGEYAAHPERGVERLKTDTTKGALPDKNTLEGALAEAAFLTNLERNADVVVMASYAPLFARIGYAQWSPDMIWFDATDVYPTASYYVQQLYSCNMGNVVLDTKGQEKEAAKDGLYYSISYLEGEHEAILKIVNANEDSRAVRVQVEDGLILRGGGNYRARTLAAAKTDGETAELAADTDKSGNSTPADLLPEAVSVTESEGAVADEILLPGKSFTVIKF